MKKLRTFLAVEVSPDVKTRATSVISRLAVTGDRVNWVEPENMHISLKFFGDISELEVYEITKALAVPLKEVPPLAIKVSGIGAFPRSDRPRTIWAGVTEGREEMLSLQEKVEKSLRRLGYRREHRRYQPHLTLGRVRVHRPDSELVNVLQGLTQFDLGETVIDEVVLLSSELHSSGPEYTRLADFPLEA